MLLSIPMESTRPLIGVAEPSRVMVAGWPTLISPTSETLTVVVASSPPAPSMTKSALVLVPWLPVTCWPEVTLTRATVPLMGAARVAAARFCRASLSSALAESRSAWSDASCAAVAGPELAEPPAPPLSRLRTRRFRRCSQCARCRFRRCRRSAGSRRFPPVPRRCRRCPCRRCRFLSRPSSQARCTPRRAGDRGQLRSWPGTARCWRCWSARTSGRRSPPGRSSGTARRPGRRSAAPIR